MSQSQELTLSKCLCGGEPVWYKKPGATGKDYVHPLCSACGKSGTTCAESDLPGRAKAANLWNLLNRHKKGKQMKPTKKSKK